MGCSNLVGGIMNKTWKISLIMVVAALIILLPASIVMGGTKGALKGTVGLINDVVEDEFSFTLESKYGEVTVFAPAEFFPDLAEGMTVLVKGEWLSEEEYQAEWVKQIGSGKESEEDEEGEEAFQNAFCTGAKETNHPLVDKIYEKYVVDGEFASEIDADTINGWFCEGHSFGQIMLAFTTHFLNSDLDPYDVLLMRKDGGMGWGKIWKEFDLIGSEREGLPPGWIHKPDKDIPPGLQNKPSKP
jgi:hypothetical protein